MSPLDVACLTACLLGAVFAFAAWLAIALGRQVNDSRDREIVDVLEPSGFAWLLRLLVDFAIEFPKATFLLKAMFLTGCAAALAGAAAFVVFP